MAKIKQNIIDMIKSNFSIQGAIIEVADKHPRTIENWLNSNNEMLTSYSVLKVIVEKTGLSEEEILEPQTTNA